jgi:hypothetical protein
VAGVRPGLADSHRPRQPAGLSAAIAPG